MQNVSQNLSRAEVSNLKAFLGSPRRPKGTLSFFELQGFLFCVASSPETIPTSDWIPFISNDEDPVFKNETEALQILNLIMALYNNVNSGVLERSDALPFGCKFRANTLANFDEQASISQWSRGFMMGHEWLTEVWDQHLPDTLENECGASTMALSFFSSRQLAEAYYAELWPSGTAAPDLSFEQFAETIRDNFTSALLALADIGRTIFEVHMAHATARTHPARSTRIGRDETCPCGSGRQYKKCCLKKLH